jgi:hypothetical protein
MKRPFLNFLYLFLLSLFVYLQTLAPTVIWGDSAFFAVSVRKSSLRIGTASDHPLYILLGRVFALLPGELAWTLNLLSAVFGALTVALVYLITFKLTYSRSAGWIAAAALCVSHAFWLHAVITEVYTLHAFFVALLIYMLLVWRKHHHTTLWLFLIISAFLLGLTNHIALASLFPALVYFVLATDPSWAFGRKGVLGMVGILSVVLLLFLTFPAELINAVKKFWFGPPGISHYFTFPEGKVLGKEILFYFLYLMYQFPLVGFVLGFLGIKRLLMADLKAGIFLLLIMVVNGLFFIKTTVWQSLGSTKYTFYIPDYVVFSIFIGYGAFAITQEYEDIKLFSNFQTPPFLRLFLAAVVITLSLLTYNLAPLVVKGLNIDLLHARTLPFRDNNAFFLNPNKRGEDGARRFSEQTFNIVKPNSVLIADFTPYYVLLYFQEVQGLRPDVTLISSIYHNTLKDLDQKVTKHISQRPVYLADINPTYYRVRDLEKNFKLIPVGPIFEVVKNENKF